MSVGPQPEPERRRRVGEARSGASPTAGSPWSPSKLFPEHSADDSNVHLANLTLHYNVMPYVGLLTSGVAATA